VAEWRTALPKTPDFKLPHVRDARDREEGFYVVVASVLGASRSPNQLNADLPRERPRCPHALGTDGDLEVFTVAGGKQAVAGPTSLSGATTGRKVTRRSQATNAEAS
jgi:hypothetical protein